MKRSKKTQAEIEYAKELRRIKQFINRSAKRGWNIPLSAIPEKPKRITKASVRKLKKIKPDLLYKKGRYGGELTYGEIVSGKKGIQLEKEAKAQRAKEALQKARAVKQERKQRFEAAKKRQREERKGKKQEEFALPKTIYSPPEGESSDIWAQIIISNFRSHIAQFNDMCRSILGSWLNTLIQTKGEHDVAVMLEEGASAGNIITYKIAYKKELILGYIARMLDYLPDEGELFKSGLMEALEEEEDWGNY